MIPEPAELMRVLDEKYISNPVIWHEARMAGYYVIDGAPLRDSTGALDRDLIRSVVANGVAQIQRFHMRARSMPLGITTPVWVNADVDPDYHVRFTADGVDPALDEARILAGFANPEMRTDASMWNVVVTELASGAVGFVILGHHAMGDGFFSMRVMEALSSAVPLAPDYSFADLPRGDHRPWFSVLAEATRGWFADYPAGRVAWAEYWRKPFLRRLKRWGGRLLRPARFRASARTGLPPHLAQRNYRVAELDLRSAKARARELGGSVTDLLVSALLIAVDRCVPGDVEPAISVPIARKESVVGDHGNHISMARATADRGAELTDLVPRTREAILAAVEEGAVSGAVEWNAAGYATYLPWHVRRRYFGRSEIESLTFWPTIAPHESMSALAISYAGRLRVAVIANGDVDIDGAMTIITDAMRATASVQEQHDD